MSVDLFIWSSVKLLSGNQMLLESGYEEKSGCYERFGSGFSVSICCSEISAPDETPAEIERAVPGVKYLTEINIMGITGGDSIDYALLKNLAAELNGVIEDPQSGVIVTPDGIKQISFGPVNPEAFAVNQGIKKPRINLAFNVIFFAVMAVVMAALIIVLTVINPAGLPFSERIIGISICSAALLFFIAYVLFFVLQRKKYGLWVRQDKMNNIRMEPETSAPGIPDNEYEEGMKKAALYDYDVNKRRFEYKDGDSDKFWHVNRIGEYYYVHYGRNGTFGRIDIKEAESEDDCADFVEKTIKEKLIKGYAEISGAGHNDCFEAHKAACRSTLDSMYFMFSEDVPLIYIASVKTACETFCDLLRQSAENGEKVNQCVKSLVLYLNRIAEDPGVIETEEREMLSEYIDIGVKLAGITADEDIAGTWREW